MLLLRKALTLTVLISAIALFPDSFAGAQSLDAGAWTQVFVRECGSPRDPEPPNLPETYPDCGDVQSELRVTDADQGVTGLVNSAVIRAQPVSKSFASAGYDGAAFSPAISAYSHSALGERIIASGIVLQSYEFLSSGVLTGTATFTFAQSGRDGGGPFLRTPRGYLLSGVVTFRTDNGLFEPAKCGVDDLTTGVALVTCITSEALSQKEGNAPGLVYEGARDFVNTEFDPIFNQQTDAMQDFEIRVTGTVGDVVFISTDMFIFANNGGFGNSRNTLKVELDNPELVQAAFQEETFVPAPQPVDMDIRPFSSKNKIRPRSWGFIPVAILGSQEFDALQVKIATARFGPDNAKAIRWLTRIRDINHDGFPDLFLLFKTRKTGIQCGDTEAILTGDTHTGDLFIGVDSITTVGCN